MRLYRDITRSVMSTAGTLRPGRDMLKDNLRFSGLNHSGAMRTLRPSSLMRPVAISCRASGKAWHSASNTRSLSVSGVS